MSAEVRVSGSVCFKTHIKAGFADVVSHGDIEISFCMYYLSPLYRR